MNICIGDKHPKISKCQEKLGIFAVKKKGYISVLCGRTHAHKDTFLCFTYACFFKSKNWPQDVAVNQCLNKKVASAVRKRSMWLQTIILKILVIINPPNVSVLQNHYDVLSLGCYIFFSLSFTKYFSLNSHPSIFIWKFNLKQYGLLMKLNALFLNRKQIHRIHSEFILPFWPITITLFSLMNISLRKNSIEDERRASYKMLYITRIGLTPKQ